MANENNIKEFDFKSVGVKTVSPKSPNPNLNKPIGLKTPMRLGSEDIFQMNKTIKDQIKDNFRNLLLTNHGERVGLFDFGGNLRELSLELSSEKLDDELLVRINTATSKYMPYITLDRMQREIINFDNENVAKLKIKIFYSVPFFRIFNQVLEISFFIGA